MADESIVDFEIFDSDETEKEMEELLSNINEEFEIVIEEDDVVILRESETLIDKVPFSTESQQQGSSSAICSASTSASTITSIPLQCPICNLIFKRMPALENHLDMVHFSDNSQEIENNEQDDEFIPLLARQEEELSSPPPQIVLVGAKKRKSENKKLEEEVEGKKLKKKFQPKQKKDGKGKISVKKKRQVKQPKKSTVNISEVSTGNLFILHTNIFAYLIETINEASSDKYLTLKLGDDYKSVGNIAAEIASVILAKKENVEVNLKTFSESLFESITPAIKLYGTKKFERVLQCGILHKMKIHEKLRQDFFDIVDLLNTNVCNKRAASDILYTHIINKLFYKLIKLRTSLYSPEVSNQTMDLSLTPTEEKILRYVAGFIPFSLLKRFKNKSSEMSKVVCKLIETWKSGNEESGIEDNLSDYTKTWIERVNRGGLFNVNDPFYRFICRVEMTARQVLNIRLMSTYKGEDLREVLMQEFEKDKILDVAWSNLIRKVYNEQIVNGIKLIILKKWIHIRARAFVNVWIQCAKRKQLKHSKGMSDKGEPSLRKTLHVKKR